MTANLYTADIKLALYQKNQGSYHILQSNCNALFFMSWRDKIQ